MLRVDQKIVIVTRQTRMKGLLARHVTAGRAKFLLERNILVDRARNPGAALAAGAVAPEAEFDALAEEDRGYSNAIEQLQRELDLGLKVQVIDRSYLPNFVFGPHDIVVTVGQDGLVANTAKYAGRLPIVAVNPDPAHIDGILLPFTVDRARMAVRRVLGRQAAFHEVTMAQATLADGQRLLAFNDFFVGTRTHVSARYRIEWSGRTETQISSGVLISTGAGSTGWFSSVFNMARGVALAFGKLGDARLGMRLPWDDARLLYVVREPFASKQSFTNLVGGVIEPRQELVIESKMSEGGLIFSDGVESDYLEFNSGAIAHICAAEQPARLVAA